jgi:hypothetical protein
MSLGAYRASLAECLEREIREDMGIKIKVDGRVITVDHKYPTFDIRLCAMKAEILGGEMNLNDHVGKNQWRA